MVLQHAVHAAEMALAETAIADDALGGGFTVFEGAFLFSAGVGGSVGGGGGGV